MADPPPNLNTPAARDAWVRANPTITRPGERRVYCIDPASLRAVLQAITFGNATAGPFIDRGGALSATSAGTIAELNDNTLAPALIAAALGQMRRDSASFGARFPVGYYARFGRAMIEHAIGTLGPVGGVAGARDCFGVEVAASPSFAAYHAYEAVVRTGADTGWDKVQHFVRSAALAFSSPKPAVDTAQYGKEIVFDALPGLVNGVDHFDPADMLANNRGQAYGAELLERYRPYRAQLYSPSLLFRKQVTEPVGHVVQQMEREIYRIYGVPYW